MIFAGDFPRALRTLDKYGGIEAFMAAFEATEKPSDDDVHNLMTLAMAASYDPDPTAFLGVRLPVDLHTCERIPEDAAGRGQAHDASRPARQVGGREVVVAAAMVRDH
jgi:hypothetical protein